MAKLKQPPVRYFRCPECGDETTWDKWWVPAIFQCINYERCGGVMVEVMRPEEEKEDV